MRRAVNSRKFAWALKLYAKWLISLFAHWLTLEFFLPFDETDRKIVSVDKLPYLLYKLPQKQPQISKGFKRQIKAKRRCMHCIYGLWKSYNCRICQKIHLRSVCLVRLLSSITVRNCVNLESQITADIIEHTRILGSSSISVALTKLVHFFVFSNNV